MSHYNLSKLSIGDQFFGCPCCGTMQKVGLARRMICPNPQCEGFMDRRKVSRHPLMPGERIDLPVAYLNDDQLLRRAEHEISYSAKRAIEMYIPVWEAEPAWNLFLKCAQAHALSKDKIEACKRLMRQFGMVEEEVVMEGLSDLERQLLGVKEKGV